jgi:hypothetical protein
MVESVKAPLEPRTFTELIVESFSSSGELNSESFDSFAPAHLKLGRAPASSPLPSRLCLDHSHGPVLAPAT